MDLSRIVLRVLSRISVVVSFLILSFFDLAQAQTLSGHPFDGLLSNYGKQP